MLRRLSIPSDPNLLVGFETADDAAVYRLDDATALVQTVDFFPPVVDDPYDYGAIAMANALSDLYAMGARPLIGLNIACFPAEGLSLDILAEILRGGAEKAREAGLLIVGGHTIDDREPKYGAAVTGLVRPGEQITNGGARPGDRLFLTKPLGIGVITTAIKAGVAPPEVVALAIGVMATLNRAASEAMREVGVTACTDVTGYGLLGHAREMAQASGVGIVLRAGAVPVLEGAAGLADLGVVPGGTFRNMTFLEGQVDWDPAVDALQQLLLADAQTSGGLLIAVPAGRGDALAAALARHGVSTVAEVGFCEAPAGPAPLRVAR